MGCQYSTPTPQSPPPSFPNEPKGFVFVYNLPPNITVSQLEKKFHQFGNVTRDEIRLFTKGSSTAHAYIEFETKSSAMRAIQAEHVVIGGRKVFIEETMLPLPPNSS